MIAPEDLPMTIPILMEMQKKKHQKTWPLKIMEKPKTQWGYLI